MNRRLAILLVALVALPGCALFSKLLGLFQKPSLSFKTANLRDTSLAGTTLDLVYLVDNPNPIGLSVARVSYKLQVEGHDVMSGQPQNGAHIPAKGTIDLTFPATVRFADLASTLVDFLGKDQASWTASGEVGFDTPIGLLTFPLSKTGSFPVPKLPAISIDTPKIDSLNFSSAKVTFPIKITNRNSFPLPLSGLEANIKVAGTQIGSTALSSLPELLAGDTKTVDLPLNIDLMSAGSAVAAAVRGQAVDVQLDGILRTAGMNLPIKDLQKLVFRK